MKRYHIYYFLIICALGIFTSCSNDDNGASVTAPNALAELSTTSISFFDINSDIKINLTAEEDVNFNSLEIFKNGDKISDATVDGSTGTFNSSALLPFTFGEEMDEKTGNFDLSLVYNLSNGVTASRTQNLSVTSAFSLENEVATYKFGDTLKASIEYKINTDPTTIIDAINAFWKNGSDGNFTEIDKTFGKTEAIQLADGEYLDYDIEIGDTLFYEFRATSGALVDTLTTSVVFVPQGFGELKQAVISSDSLSGRINLATGNVLSVPKKDEMNNGEIQFTSPFGIEKIEGIDISFVRLSDVDTPQEFFSNYNNISNAKETFEASGDKQTSIQANVGDLFLYKITRLEDSAESDSGKEFYGIMVVNEITIVNSNEMTSIDLSFKENSILE